MAAQPCGRKTCARRPMRLRVGERSAMDWPPPHQPGKISAVNRLRWGMVGGGPNSIGRMHRLAASLDGHYELVAGVFSRDPAKNAAMGKELGIAPDRLYADFNAMAAAEARRADGIECVTIVTPNNTHVPASLAFLDQKTPVICDKPLAISAAEAVRLMQEVERRRIPFALTHNYS